MRLRKNLGHPKADALVRVLRNWGGLREGAGDGKAAGLRRLQPARTAEGAAAGCADKGSAAAAGWIGGPVTAPSLNVVDVGSELHQMGRFFEQRRRRC